MKLLLLYLTALMAYAQATQPYPEHWWTPVNDSHKPDWEILPQAARPGEVILSKRNELGILSNFAATPFTYKGQRYASVEGFWQMMLYPENAADSRAKANGLVWRYTRTQVAQMASFEAKEAGTLAEENMHKMDIDWVTFDGARIPYRSMTKGEHYRLIREAMQAKLDQNPKVRETLLATGNLVLGPDHVQEEDAPPEWAYFQIWMEIRTELQRSADVAFSDQPTFVVAGVTNHTYVGGHGADTRLRSSEALTTAVDFLKTDQNMAGSEAALHHTTAASDESSGKPLDAVQEYQRAAELDPSEGNLFDWGCELLRHAAPQAAAGVFQKSLSRYPKSTRILLGDAVALYAEAQYAEARKQFLAASDINPQDPLPYLFLAKTQAPEITDSEGYLDRLRRFAQLHPDDPQANYFYAVALWNRRAKANDSDLNAHVETLLKNAVRLKLHFAEAYLQLGLLYEEQQQTDRAMDAYQEAIASDPKLEQAHYRLAALYRKLGQPQQAQHETEMFNQLKESSIQQHEKERSDLQRFVVTLKANKSDQ